jgi:hypothetical protein
VHPRDRSAQLEVTPGRLAMEAGSGGSRCSSSDMLSASVQAGEEARWGRSQEGRFGGRMLGGGRPRSSTPLGNGGQGDGVLWRPREAGKQCARVTRGWREW